MLERLGVCRSIADVELIPKMLFLSKSIDGLKKNAFYVRHDIFLFGSLVSPRFK